MENKKKFVEELGRILMMYSREEVEKLEYIRESETELVCITYMNGLILSIILDTILKKLKAEPE